MKHTSRFMLFASLIAAFGMLCCSEDNDTTEDNDISNCTDGTWKCDGNTLSKCISGKWETIHICDENTLCNIATGTCAPNDTSNCTDGTWKCDGNTLSKCTSGKWEFSQTCKENTQCNSKTGTCEASVASECTDGSWKCDGDILLKCASGKWEISQTCEKKSQCNAEAGTCLKCNDDEHKYNNTCEINSIENCGEHDRKCKNIENASVRCEGRKQYAECQFDCNDGYARYITKKDEEGNYALSDECVPAFQSTWKMPSVYKDRWLLWLPVDYSSIDKSKSVTIDWGDGTYSLIHAETETKAVLVQYPFGEEVSKLNEGWSHKYVSHLYCNNKMKMCANPLDDDTQVVIKVVGTIHWRTNRSAFGYDGKLISIQSYGNTIFDAHAFCAAEMLEHLPSEETPKLTNDMSGFFEHAKKFNQNINFWDTSNVTDMSEMFMETEAFNQPLDHWDTSKVTNMKAMFKDAEAFNQPLNNWDTSNVANMSEMFYEAHAFNQPLNNWDTSSVTDMSYMFTAAVSFNQPLDHWNTSKVTNMKAMFHSTDNFNGAIHNWDTSNVENMNGVFLYAAAFNQPLDHWDVSNATDMGAIFEFSGLQKDNYCKLFMGAYSSYWNKYKGSLGKSYTCN